MSHKLISILYPILTTTFGNLLILIQPKKARQLSEDRMILVNKSNMSISEKLMRGALVKKLDKIEDHNKIAALNHNFWINKKATELFSNLDADFETDFLPHCSFIFDLLKKELSNQSVDFNTLVEIGTGSGNVINYLSSELSTIDHFVGIDLSPDQIEINKEKYKKNEKLQFVTADALDWVKKNGHGKTIFVTCRGVLEYFLEPRLQELLNEISALGKIMFVAVEPNGENHNFETHPNSQLYGHEPSFSHNYPKLFQNAGFSVWHFSQKSWSGNGGDKQTCIGVKNC